jgi:hypothetical protein
LKPPGFNPPAYEAKTWFQSLPSHFNLYRYAVAGARAPLLEAALLSPEVTRRAAVGRCKLNSVESYSLKATGFNP